MDPTATGPTPARAVWFTGPRQAELLDEEVRSPGPEEVLVRGVASLVSQVAIGWLEMRSISCASRAIARIRAGSAPPPGNGTASTGRRCCKRPTWWGI